MVQDLTSARNHELAEQVAELDRAWAGLSRAVTKTRIPPKGEADLTVAQYVALRDICERGPFTMGELAGLLAVAESTASRMVDRLVDAELVSRGADPADRRRVIVQATLRGRRLLARARRRRAAQMARFLERLSATERRQLVRLIGKLAAVASEDGGSADAEEARR